MFTNSVYQIVGLYIDNKVFSLENTLQPHDYFGTTEDIAIFNLNETTDANIVSGLRYCRKIICNSKIEIRTSIWYTLYYKNTGYSIWQRQIS